MAGCRPDGYGDADARSCSCYRGGDPTFGTCRARETGLCLRTACAKGTRKSPAPRKAIAAFVARGQRALRQLSTVGVARLAAGGMVAGARNEEIAGSRIRRSHFPNECGCLSAMGGLAACRP